MPETPTWADVINRAITSKLSDVHVAMPGRVHAYSASRNTVDVAPQYTRSVEREDGSFADEDLPIIPDVPIAWPRGGGGSFFITWPLSVGDPVLIVFCEKDLGVWRERGEPGTTGDQRTHGLSGAVAYPGLFANSEALDSSKVHATKMVVGSEVFLGAATAAQSMVLGDAFKALYDAHTHPTAMGPSGAPLIPITTQLSTKHKLDG